MTSGYELDVLVHGFPGKTATHGGLGWSSVYVLRDGKRTVLIDTGPPAYLSLLYQQFERLGISPADITDILCTHLHWDHIGNLTAFPNAAVTVGRTELEWAAQQPPGTPLVADLHVRRLVELRERVHLVEHGQDALPGVRTIDTPGHTPGHVCYQAAIAAGTVFFAGDAVKNRFELATGEVDASLDFEASRASVHRIRAMMEHDPSAIMFPGHDVPLTFVNGEVTATEPQRAELSVFLDTHSGAAPRKIT